MSGLDTRKMQVYIELVKRKAELPPEKQAIVSELGKRFAVQAGGDPTGKGVDTFGGTVLPEALGTMRSALMAPIEHPVETAKTVLGVNDPMNLALPKALIGDVASGNPELAAGKALGVAGAAALTAGAAKVAPRVAAGIKSKGPTPEGLMQRAATNRAAAESSTSGGVPTTKTGVVVNAAKRAASPARRLLAMIEEKAALKLAGDKGPLIAGNPEAGSAAFMPENLTRPPDSPPSMFPGTNIPRPQGWGRSRGAAELPEPEPIGIPRPKPGEIPQLPPTSRPPLTAPEVNKWMNVREKQLMYGNDPGKQVLADKLLGPDKATTLKNVESARGTVGKLMEASFKASERKGVRFNLDAEIQAAIADAKKTYGKGSDEAFMKQLDNLQDQFVQHSGDLKNATPSEAHAFERDLGKGINWDSAATSDLARVMKDMRARVNRLLKANVSGIGPLKDRWGNLYEAEKALKSSIRKDDIGRGTGAAPNQK